MAHVIVRLGLAERVEPPAHADPLAQLAQLEPREARVEQVRDLGIRTETLEQCAAERGLAGADLAGNRNETLALLDPVEQMGERLAMRGGEVEIARIGREGERLLSQPVVP